MKYRQRQVKTMSKMEYVPKNDRDNNNSNKSILVKVGMALAGMVVALGTGLYNANFDENLVPNVRDDIAIEQEYETEDEEQLVIDEHPVVIEEQSETAEDQSAVTEEQAETAEEPQSIAEDQPAIAEVRFRNSKLLNSHYDKHGIEMGFDSAQEYEQAAAQVVANPDALHKTEAEDGDDVYYLESTNDFVIVSTDGYIRTYFRPDKGKSYYDRQ